MRPTVDPRDDSEPRPSPEGRPPLGPGRVPPPAVAVEVAGRDVEVPAPPAGVVRPACAGVVAPAGDGVALVGNGGRPAAPPTRAFAGVAGAGRVAGPAGRDVVGGRDALDPPIGRDGVGRVPPAPPEDGRGRCAPPAGRCSPIASKNSPSNSNDRMGCLRSPRHIATLATLSLSAIINVCALPYVRAFYSSNVLRQRARAVSAQSDGFVS